MSLVRLVCAAWILPAGFSLIAFFGFFTNYTTDVFSRSGMAAQYERSVFRYRILGRYLVDAVSNWFEHTSMAWTTPRAFTVLDPSGTAPTYWAYVSVHTVFTCIGCSLLLIALRKSRNGILPELAVVGVSMALALEAFVVTPYDGLFFALQMAALALTLTVAPRTALAPLAVVTLFAALTRETAYFIPAFFLAVHHRRVLDGDRDARATLAVSAAVVIVTYVGLRAWLGWSGATSVFYAWQGASNLKWSSLTGSAMLVSALVLLLGDGSNRTSRRWYAVVSVPYILFVHVFAEPWEWRLWIPILVPIVALMVVPERDRAVAA